MGKYLYEVTSTPIRGGCPQRPRWGSVRTLAIGIYGTVRGGYAFTSANERIAARSVCEAIHGFGKQISNFPSTPHNSHLALHRRAQCLTCLVRAR